MVLWTFGLGCREKKPLQEEFSGVCVCVGDRGEVRLSGVYFGKISFSLSIVGKKGL